MNPSTTTTNPSTRRRVLIVAGSASIGLAALGGLALATGAAASGTAAQPPSAAASAPTRSTMAQVWADTDAATHAATCTAFLANPAGTWQVLAPAFAAEGITRADAEAFLVGACPAQDAIAALRS